jgi:hypothetical protein
MMKVFVVWSKVEGEKERLSIETALVPIMQVVGRRLGVHASHSTSSLAVVSEFWGEHPDEPSSSLPVSIILLRQISVRVRLLVQ